jgi:serine/threonine protein kinase
MSMPHAENDNPVSRLLEEALKIEDPGERQKYLEQACDGNQVMLADVMSLLAFADTWEDFSEKTSDLVGRSIGKYEIKSEIGRGGMGTVYLAVRTQDYKQVVAIKLINQKMLSQDGVRQFGKEMKNLARLNHPNLPRLIDGGETEDGLRYVVMEYIDGQHLDAYCDTNRLTIRERLALFCKVCSVVADIHGNKIIHRDIKPSNILVTAEGEPKLIDFGIAKALNPAFDTVTYTNFLRPLSLHYASPEQLRGDPVGETSDVYSLGAVLYELLTGHRAHKFADDNFGELLKVVCETEATPPSKVISVEEAAPDGDGKPALTPASVSAARGTQPSRLRRQLAGDLDCILLKALCKTPRHRYENVKALLADIDNHLNGRPVAARKGAWWKSFDHVTRGFMHNLPPTGLGVKKKLAVYLLLLAAFVVVWQVRERTAQRGSHEVRQVKLQRAINTLSSHVSLHLRNLGREKEERTGWEASQLAISNWRLKAFDEPHVVNYLNMSMKEGCHCYEFPLKPSREENIAASGWVVLAMSKMKAASGNTAPSAGQVEFILKNQNQGGGWWPIYSSHAEFETDASTYATAISVLALYEYWKSGVKTYGDEGKLRAAVEHGQAWLLSTRVPDKARWLDSPRNRAAQESVGLSGLVIHVLHRTEAAQEALNEIDRLWRQNLPALGPDAKTHEQSTLLLSDGRTEITNNNVMQWAIVATAHTLVSASEAERRVTDAWMNGILDDIDNIALGVLDNTDWVAAELLIALRQYKGETVM